MTSHYGMVIAVDGGPRSRCVCLQVVDVTPDRLGLFLVCLEDWSEEAQEAGSRRGEWYEKMKHRGVRAKLALDDRGEMGGMIQYLPIEASFVEGRGLYFIPCIWVHGHPQGRGNFQGRGMGSALLRAAEEDARDLGASGMAAWGLSVPFWLPASWYRKHGYAVADRDGMAVLLWKRFRPGAEKPRWIRKRKEPRPGEDALGVVSFVSGWCMSQNLVYERAKRAARGFGDRVRFSEIDTSDKEVQREWGISDALYVDGKEVRTGPPPSYESIRATIEKRARRIRGR